MDYNFGFTLDSVTAHSDELAKNSAEINGAATEKKGSIESIHKELSDLGAGEGVFPSIQEVNASFEQLQTELKNRQESYQNELTRQKLFEDKRKEFSQKAQSIVEHITQQRAELEKGKKSFQRFFLGVFIVVG